jgi:hypothetical protein
MTYAKFVTKLNKEGKQVSYGPYYYRSIRTPEGKVRNIYLGARPEEEDRAGSMRRLKEALVRLMAP